MYVDDAKKHSELNLNDYLGKEINQCKDLVQWENHEIKIFEKQVNQINQYFADIINRDKKTMIIGEDIADPYGGAFKVTKGLSTKFKDNIISTPISEAGIVGMGIGMSLLGYNPFIEIMFGDFISYAFNQILSNASKFFYMYNKQVSVPITIRTPMGGGRGYGPTHSQSIEKIFNGLNNIRIVALNTLIDSKVILKSIENYKHTTILIENKIDYGRLENKLPKTVSYTFKKSNTNLPIIVCSPNNIEPEISIITYGAAVHCALESVDRIFYEFEVFPKIIVLTELYPLQISQIALLTYKTGIILTLEEGNVEGGIGSEIVSALIECNKIGNKKFKRIGSINIPIPATKQLEEKILINTETIITVLRSII